MIKRFLIALIIGLVCICAWAAYNDLGSLPFSQSATEGGYAVIGPPAAAGGATTPEWTNGIASWLLTDNRANSNDYVNGAYPDESGNSVTGYQNTAGFIMSVADNTTNVFLTSDGNDDYIDHAPLISVVDYTNGTKGALSIWAKIASDTGAQEIFYGPSTASGNYYGYWVEFDMRAANNNLRVIFWQNHSEQWRVASPAVIIAEKWYHIVIEQNGTNIVGYTNGVTGTLTVTGSAQGKWMADIYGNANRETIGGWRADGTTYSAAASVDSVMIWTNTILGTNALTIFNNQKANYGY